MTLACTAARKRVYAETSLNARNSASQTVRCHIAPLDRSRIVRFNLTLATFRLLERMFYNLLASSGCVKQLSLAAIVHAPL